MKDYDDEKATAEYISLSVHWLRKRRLRRLPPTYLKIGRKVLYARGEIDRFLQQHSVKPGIGRSSQPSVGGDHE